MSKILIVEDNEFNRDMLSRRLLRKGFDVLVAEDGNRGIQLARTAHPDIILMDEPFSALDAITRDEMALVLLDLSMPGMDGMELQGKIREAAPELPVIVMTGYASVETAVQALKQGKGLVAMVGERLPDAARLDVAARGQLIQQVPRELGLMVEDLIVETSQALEMANTYTNILNSTLDAFASIISNNQNEVLKRLTTLTIFLSVPVLIASIYGMNVPIPYKDSHLAFWLPVTLSFIILAFTVWNYAKRIRK